MGVIWGEFHGEFYERLRCGIKKLHYMATVMRIQVWFTLNTVRTPADSVLHFWAGKQDIDVCTANIHYQGQEILVAVHVVMMDHFPGYLCCVL